MLTGTVVIPDVHLTLEQLIGAIRQLDSDARSKVAQALLDDEMDERFEMLINRLANKTSANDITDEEIDVEIYAIRQQQL